MTLNEISHYQSLKKLDTENRKLIKKLQLERNALKKQLSLKGVVKSSYCECTAPLVRTSVNMDEYCGNCELDIEQ